MMNYVLKIKNYKQGDSPTHRSALASWRGYDSQAQIRLRVAIRKRYQQEPVPKLTSDYGLLVNITGAMLDSLKRDRGWLDLELRGRSNQIGTGIAYLQL